MISVTARVWAFTVYSYVVTTLSAAWFARWEAAERGENLGVPTSLLWQGAIYAAWLPVAGLVWLILRRCGSGLRGMAVLAAAGVIAIPLEAIGASAINGLFSPGPLFRRALEHLPVSILLYTAIVAVGLAASHYRRAVEARALARELEAALAAAREALMRADHGAASPNERLMVMAGARRVPVDLAEIEWFSAADNYVVVHWNGREGLMRATLQSLETRLDPKVFARSHRSTLINLARVRDAAPLADGSWRLTMESGDEVVTSRTYRDDLLRRLGR